MTLNKNYKTKSILYSIIKVVSLSLLVFLIAMFFISKKANLDIDEMYTYGLANNQFQFDINNYEELTGNDAFLKYVAANENHLFDIKNVFFNQKMDTHPPLYFLLINFICSINKDNFSIIYGISINIIFLIILYWETLHLIYLITQNKVFAAVTPLIALTTYGYINNYSFTRMYVMLSAISMAFIILIINFIKSTNNLNIKFLVKFYLICTLGLLTHYHFVIIAFFFSILLAVKLLLFKRYREFFIILITGILSIVSSLLIFPDSINHIFNNPNSTHALTQVSQNVNFTRNLSTLFQGLINSFFGYSIILYVLLLIIGVFTISLKKKWHLKNTICNFNLYICIATCSIFYFLVICCTVRLSFHRYLYNIYPLIIIFIIIPMYYLYCSFGKSFTILSIVAMCIFSTTSLYNNNPTSLNTEDAYFDEYLYNYKDTPALFLYRSIDKKGLKNSIDTSLWKLPAPLYLFRNLDKVFFMDLSEDTELSHLDNLSPDDLFLIIYTYEDDDYLLNAIMHKYNLNDYQKIYFTTYFHVYRLS